ncbi:MAG: TolC family protein [Blastocatellia bacterium]
MDWPHTQLLRHLFSLFLALVLVCPLAAPLVAQPAAPLTLEDCIRKAEAAPNALTLAQQDRAIADRDVVQARASFKPQAEILSGFTYNSPRVGDPATFSFAPLNGIRQYTALGVISQEFDTSGRLRAELQRARANQQIASVNLEIARRDLRRAVAIAYYRVLLARHLVSVLGEELTGSRDFQQRAQTLFEGGEVARADVVKAAAQVALLEQSRAAAELEAKLANQELAAFWTTDVDTPLEIVDSLETTLPTPTPETNTTPAPYLKRLEFSLLAAERFGFEAEARRARAALLPQFTFNYQFGLDATTFSFRERGQAAYFNLRIPVFDWWRARSQVEQSRFRIAQVETNRAISQRTFSREYQNARARVQQLYAQIALTREQIRLSEEDLKLTRLRYEGGEGLALDVVISQNQLAQARTNYYTAIANYLNARADLEAASGQ